MEKEYVVEIKYYISVFANDEASAKDEALMLLSEDMDILDPEIEMAEISIDY
jgi:hypothetical protein